MEKKLLVVFTVTLIMLTGCCLKHEYAEATCTEPATCVKCGKTEGEPTGHDFSVPATCTEPKKCSVCGESYGKANGHKKVKVDGVEATCTEEGKTESSYCSVCGEILKESTVIQAKGHDWENATHKKPKTCKTCGQTSGSKIAPAYFNISFEEYEKQFNSNNKGICSIIKGNGAFYLKVNGVNSIKTKGTSNAILVFNDDELDGAITAYSTEELDKFNRIKARFIVEESSYNSDNMLVMAILSAPFAQVMDKSFSVDEFSNNWKRIGGYKYDVAFEWDHAGFHYELRASDESVVSWLPDYWYEFEITLLSNKD